MRVIDGLLAVLIATALPTAPTRAAALDDYVADASYKDLEHASEWREPGSDGYPACVGQANGTAHPSCGSATGGPSGGLF